MFPEAPATLMSPVASPQASYELCRPLPSDKLTNDAHILCLAYPSSIFVWVAKWSLVSKLEGYYGYFCRAARLAERKQGTPEVWLA